MVFAAGADITQFPGITPERAREGSAAGHALFGRIRALPYPTLAALTGAALGGGIEIALHCDVRTVASSTRHLALPEVFLGLIPGWGGTQLLPRARRRGACRARDRRQPARAQPHAARRPGARARARRPRARAGRPRRRPRSSCSCDRDRGRHAEARLRRRPRRRRRGLRQCAPSRRRRGARRRSCSVPRARPDRGDRDLDDRGGLPGGAGRRRGAASRATGAGVDLRLRRRRAADQARRRRARCAAAPGAAGRRGRCRADGDAAGDALPATAGGARGADRRRRRSSRRRARADPRRARGPWRRDVSTKGRHDSSPRSSPPATEWSPTPVATS